MFKLLINVEKHYQSLIKIQKDEALQGLQKRLKNQIKTKFSSTLKLYIMDTGSCNACELELQALFNPYYQISTLGVEVVYDVKKADIMLITGLLTENMYRSCVEKYALLKAPKHVVAIGDCPLFQAPFRKNFALKAESSLHLATEYHIAGCPPEPRKLIAGLVEYLEGFE